MATPLSQRLTQARTQRYKASIRPKQGSAHLKDRRKKSGATLCLTLSFSLFRSSLFLSSLFLSRSFFALSFSLCFSRSFLLAFAFSLFPSRCFFCFFLAFPFSLFLSSFFFFAHYTLRIGPPRGGHDHRNVALVERFRILSIFWMYGISKGTATPGLAFFVVIL